MRAVFESRGRWVTIIATIAHAPVMAQPFMPGAAQSQPTTQPAGAARQAPADGGAELKIAHQLLRAGDNLAAVDRLLPLVAADPHNAQAHMFLGTAYHKLRRYTPAKQHLLEALKLAPDDRRANYPLGFCLYYLGEAAAAREAFEKFLKEYPNEGHTYLGLGLIEFDAHQLDKAADLFKKSIDLNAAAKKFDLEGSAHARLGDVYKAQERFEEARDEYLKATQFAEADPSLYAAYFKLSQVLARLGDQDGARKAMEKHDETKAKVRPREGFPE